LLTREEALHFLDLAPHTPDDVAKEVLEEALFEHKKYALTQNAVPQVLQKRMEKLNQLVRIENALFQQAAAPEHTQKYRLNTTTAEDLFAQYQRHLSHCKANINQAESAATLAEVWQNWVDLKIEFYQKFGHLFSNSAIALSEAEKQQISLGKEPDAMQILEALHFYSKTNQLNVDLQKEIYRINSLLERLKTS
jgi:hypothetical protein